MNLDWGCGQSAPRCEGPSCSVYLLQQSGCYQPHTLEAQSIARGRNKYVSSRKYRRLPNERLRLFHHVRFRSKSEDDTGAKLPLHGLSAKLRARQILRHRGDETLSTFCSNGVIPASRIEICRITMYRSMLSAATVPAWKKASVRGRGTSRVRLNKDVQQNRDTLLILFRLDCPTFSSEGMSNAP
nr:hypothetical protein CFP56_64711 [Quercus suber]